MGADYNTMRMILTGLRHGADFSSLLTLARMNVNLARKDLSNAFADFGRPLPPETLDEIYAAGPYGERLLRALGAGHIESIDASKYEGATIIHDMNEPVPASLHERFTTIIDHGTTEHIFNFPIVIQNCMRMLKAGGHFLSATCANNFTGHGFYQFSPELYFRLFSAANGFLTKGVFLVEEESKGVWYRVLDPAITKQRATLVNGRPTYVMVIAQKIATVATFTTPQQSEYAAAWAGSAALASPRGHGIIALLRGYLPSSAVKPISNLRYRIWRYGFRSKKYFCPFEPASDPISVP